MEVVEKEKSEITEKRKGRNADTCGDDAGKWSKAKSSSLQTMGQIWPSTWFCK